MIKSFLKISSVFSILVKILRLKSRSIFIFTNELRFLGKEYSTRYVNIGGRRERDGIKYIISISRPDAFKFGHYLVFDGTA